jgi:hypothetical protein
VPLVVIGMLLRIACRGVAPHLRPESLPEAVAIADYIRSNSRPDDRVFIVGSEPQILFFACAAAPPVTSSSTR